MGIEIERKFLLKDHSFKAKAKAKDFYKQGYIEGPDKATVRIRTIVDKGYITIKSKSVGITRNEYEYEIPLSDAKEMLDKLCGNTVEKYRYIVEVDGNNWEVDEFLGDSEGLYVAELELKDEDQSFTKPSWLGGEVSDDYRYRNSYISSHPFKTW